MKRLVENDLRFARLCPGYDRDGPFFIAMYLHVVEFRLTNRQVHRVL